MMAGIFILLRMFILISFNTTKTSFIIESKKWRIVEQAKPVGETGESAAGKQTKNACHLAQRRLLPNHRWFRPLSR
jgi:hypothetical protein